MNKLLLMCIIELGLLLGSCREVSAADAPPNIVIILADDMGLGDVSGLNPQAKVATPHLDGMIQRGMTFTDGHSSSSVCTPTRYGLLTGRYNWRSEWKRGVLSSYSKPLIPNDRDTIASLLKRHGYRTAMVGKWHLGLGWRMNDGSINDTFDYHGDEDDIDFTMPFVGGPCDLGFDMWYGIAASLDFPPYTLFENDRVAVLPTEKRPRQGGKKQGQPQLMMRGGRQAPGFEPDQILRRLTERSIQVIESQTPGEPFFLYFPLTAPHTPVVPHPEFVGTSGCGIYGDFVQEIDWTVGQVLDALERKGLANNTIVIFTADNGTSKASFPLDMEKEFDHATSLHYKGRKASLDEGGHRVPLLVQWPKAVAAGSVSGVTCNLNDFYATAAELVGAEVASDAGEDSHSLLPLLLGDTDRYTRQASVHHDFQGRFAIRVGRWKLLMGKTRQQDELYDLEADPSEASDVAGDHPEIMKKLRETLTKIVTEGRSTPGPTQANDGPAWWSQLTWIDRP